MKSIFLFVVSVGAAAVLAAGCVGPRTGSIGYRRDAPILTTNLVGTVTYQKVGDQPPVVYAQTNFTVASTPPVQKRTGREVWTGKRPPADVRVFPPYPNAGIYGVTPSTVMVPQQAPPQRQTTAPPRRTSGPRYGIGPNGARYLLPSGTSSYGGNRNGFSSVGRRLGSFFLNPAITGGSGSGAYLAGGAYVRGRVNVPVTGFERSALEHARSIGTPVGYRPYGVVERQYNASLQVRGGATAVSGLARRY